MEKMNKVKLVISTAMMKILLLSSVTLAGLATVSSAQAQSTNTVDSEGVYISRRPHSAGVSLGGKAHVVYSQAGMDVYVRSFDSGTWGAPKRIRDNNYFSTNDYHNYPTMIRAPNGKLIVFYFQHDSRAFQLTSPNVDSTSGTWAHKEILPVAEKPGYPTAVTAGNTIYLFYRHKVQEVYRTIKMVKSTDNGATWSSPKTVIDTGNVQAGNFDEIYLNDIAYEQARFGHPERLRMTFHLAGGSYHNQMAKNVHMVYMHTSDDKWRTVAGNTLGFVIDQGDFNNAASKKLLVREVLPTSAVPFPVSQRMAAHHQKDDNDRPLVAYLHRSGSSIVNSSSRWNGSNWVHSSITNDAGWIVNDTQFVSTSKVGVLLSNNATGNFRFYDTSDGGDTWTLKWQRDFSSQFAGGADRFSNGVALGSKSSQIDFLVQSFHHATRRSNYNGDWRTFAIRH